MAIATSVPDSTSEIKFERVKFQYFAVLCGKINFFSFCISNFIYLFVNNNNKEKIKRCSYSAKMRVQKW